MSSIRSRKSGNSIGNTVVDCSHAFQEKEDQEQASELKNLDVETAEQSVTSKTDNGSEEIGKEETGKEKDRS